MFCEIEIFSSWFCLVVKLVFLAVKQALGVL